MRILLSATLVVLFTSCLLPAESSSALYNLPAASVSTATTDESSIVAGAESGLYRITASRTAVPLWTGGKVSRILRTQQTGTDGIVSVRWFFITSQGILTSTDLSSFEYRNEGLPNLTIKQYDGKETTFVKQVAPLKDIAVHPQQPDILVTATKDTVYITYDAGLHWLSLGSMSGGTSGIKAVAVADMVRPGTGTPASKNADGTENPAVQPQTDLVVFMSHPIFGFSYIYPKKTNRAWNDVTAGFEPMPTQTYPDEIGDIIPVVQTGSDGITQTQLYLSQTFIPRLYRFNWTAKRAEKIYTGKEPSDTIDGLCWDGSELLYTKPGTINSFDPSSGSSDVQSDLLSVCNDAWTALAANDTLYSAWLPAGNNNGFTLNELWLLKPEHCSDPYAEKALDRKAVYVPANHVSTQAGIDSFKKIIADNKLNALVIDMKDDYGLLRYNTTDPLVLQKGRVSKYSINLEHFVSEFKKNNTYLIARIVVFKDKNLAAYDGGKYAVWDKSTNKPWLGTKGMTDVTDPETGAVTGKEMQYYDENWVDPYSPEVWQYNIAIAKELISRGFDEIQFDYIRFPTDGLNMNQALFRWKSSGMDKESALISFLSYARRNINAPIGIDIYGANGWYRSGARTGQDVEMLSQYVDVISPMFYPSHFEQEFLNYAPYSERPYRIYFYGTYRATVIGRNRIIVRPWVQAFYLGVSYDKQYYNTDYVKKEIFGIRDSVNRGYMYWNNIGRYGDISPDAGDSVYTGSAPEASPEFRKPSFSTPRNQVNSVNQLSAAAEKTDTLSVLDSIRDQKKNPEASWPSLEKVRLLWRAYEKSGS